MNYKVTRVHKIEGNGNLKAFVDIIAFDALLIKGVRIVQGKKGLFISMPREKGADGRWYEQIHPLTEEVKDELTHTILNNYQTGDRNA